VSAAFSGNSLIHYAMVQPTTGSISAKKTHRHSFSGGAGPRLTGAAWSLLSLRTDSANRGFCISRFTLEMIFFAISIRFFFFIIMKVKRVRTMFTQGHNAASTEDHLTRRSTLLFSRG
jgi:hypothetical protein